MDGGAGGRIRPEHVSEVRRRGYTIVERILDRAQIERATEAVECVFQREREIGVAHGWHNATHWVAYMLPQKDPVFRSIAFGPDILLLVRALLGADCVLSSLNALAMAPCGEAQSLHADSPGVPGAVLSVNALLTLDDFTRETGSTRVVPFSQDWPTLDARSPAEFEKEAVFLAAPAGSLIAFNGALLHAGSANGTSRPRRALHAFFIRPWLRPQWDFPRSLSDDVIAGLTDEQKRLFGFTTGPRRYDPVNHRIL